MNLIEERLRKLKAQGVPLDNFSAVRKAYRDEYNAQLLSKDAARYAVIIENNPDPDEDDSEVETETGMTEAVATVITSTSPATTHDPLQFVPDSLMTHVKEIRQAVINAGGATQAVALGQVIEDAGGLANFTRAVKLLEAVDALPIPIPTKPQIAPIEPDIFSNIDRENQSAVNRVRESLKA